MKSKTIELKVMTRVTLLLLLLTLSACGGGSAIKKNAEIFRATQGSGQDDINSRLVTTAALAATQEAPDLQYYLGAGDVLELTVFQVEDLNTKLRVNGRGEIILPLLGTIEVKGLTLSQVEAIIVEKLAADFLQDPQLSLFVEEYRSQQITVMGSVLKPNVYSVRQSRNIFEMLSLAGGLSETASDVIRVKTMQPDPETGQLVQQDLILNVRSLLEGSEAASFIRLRGGDSILVPDAGVIFVDGAVKKPGSYVMQGETNVMKAIAMAGGIEWAGKERKVQVIRTIAGKPYAIDVDLAKVRSQTGDDVTLKDGDIVAVNFSTPKRFFSGFFKAAGQIFGYNLNAS
ncbi:MAG: polysaccharide export protein [Arenicella sp.]|nr:polysaccharide export protein [Arenicella sp.]